ncbi:MAG: riboflavin synthase [Deltaproteobacteria bacterium]|nr:riboflavin synthase [Deltaproteobacteria bacterium]
MFTGIIEETGAVISSNLSGGSGILRLEAALIPEDCRPGDSIAVNGVCLTVTSLGRRQISFDVSAETLRRSSLGGLKRGERVNLERALAANGRFGGHLVSGHIDGTGTLIKRQPEGNAIIFTFSAPPNITRYLIEKGSIAIDGISLTIMQLSGQNFSVAVIPHSLKLTTLGEKAVGDIVNLENDLVAKYIEKFLQPDMRGAADQASTLNLDLLKKHGFA